MSHQASAIPITAFIQAAGLSSRMGQDKSLLEVGGVPTIERVVRAASVVTDEIVLVTNQPERYRHLKLGELADPAAGMGPLRGIQLAVESTRTDWILNLGCDLPFLTGEFLAFLATHASCWQAVVPVDRDNRMQPMCALFHRSIADVARELLAAGERRPRVLLESVRAKHLEFARFAHISGADLLFFDMNTPADFEDARRMANRKD